MKKQFLLFVLAVFTAPLFAQQPDSLHAAFHPYWYVRAGGGYGFPACKMVLSVNYDIPASGEPVDRVVVSSFGKGVVAEVRGGYQLKPHLAFEAGVAYLRGAEIWSHTYSSGSSYVYDMEGTTARYFAGMCVSSGKKWYHPYLRMALMVATDNKVYYHFKGIDGLGLLSSQRMIYSGNLAFGYTGAAGIKLTGKRNWSVSGELSMYYNNWSPAKSVITENISKGIDEYPNMTVSQIQTSYSDTYSKDDPMSPDAPTRTLKFYYPFSSVGFSIGVQYSFTRRYPGKPVPAAAPEF